MHGKRGNLALGKRGWWGYPATMPYEWTDTPQGARRLSLWPYRSLPRRGFVVFIGATAALIALPLVAVLGSVVFWGLLPFLAGTIAAIWYFLQRSYRDGEILEELEITPERVTLTRHNPRSPNQSWQANPYWVTVEIHARGGPVENYLTLKGGDREVEIGAFLSAPERAELHPDLIAALRVGQG